MMKIIKIAVLLAAMLAVAGIFIPQNYTVSRDMFIPAPATSIHQYVEDMDRWEKWTAWDEAAPPVGNRPAAMDTGVGSGKYFSGSVYSAWFVISSNSVVDGFEYTVFLDNGDKAKAIVSFLEQGNGTQVKWTVTGSVTKPPLVAPYIALSKELVLGSELSQNLKTLRKKITQQSR